jgi:hypothetical protein
MRAGHKEFTNQAQSDDFKRKMNAAADFLIGARWPAAASWETG